MKHILRGLCVVAIVGMVTFAKKPNIILLIMDDQDIMLDSEKIMEKTHKLIVEQGIKFNNAFVTTPTCCPSRSSMLTGMYAHNHFTLTNNENCTGKIWQEQMEPQTYGVKLQQKGYKTAFFGKYLNEYNGSYVPPGWNKWFGLKGNSRYFNYKIASWESEGKNSYKKTKDGRDQPNLIPFGSEASDYLTNVITQRAKNFFVKNHAEKAPLLMAINYPAPHGPEDAHPKYQHYFDNATSENKYYSALYAHRNMTYNIQDKFKHWFVATRPPLDDHGIKFTDLLQRRRLQTLFSADDCIKKLYDAVEEAGELDNTYFVYTSDHGYHLGQFGIIKGKALPYDFDSRVPFYIRGPEIPKNETRDQIILNIDLAPTLMAIAGYDKGAERDIDGTSFLEIAKGHLEIPWRNYFLLERGKFPLNRLNPKPDKTKYLLELCESKLFKNPGNEPCQKKQTHYCYKDEAEDEWKIAKCEKGSIKGRVLENGSCCCHGCLKKQKRNQKSHKECEQGPRTKRSIWHPVHRPISISCLTNEICECEKQKRDPDVKRPDKANSRKFNEKANQSKSLLNEMRVKMKNEQKQYNEARSFHKGIREFHHKGERKNSVECKQRGLACFKINRESFDTHPKWDEDGDDCYCNTATNSTFFCIRGINATDNYLYCEFMTNEYEFYNLKTDPSTQFNIWEVNVTNSIDGGDNSELERISQIKRMAPFLKDELFNCKGEACKPEIDYARHRMYKDRKGGRGGNGKIHSRNRYRRNRRARHRKKRIQHLAPIEINLDMKSGFPH